MSEITEVCRGRWKEILLALGVSSNYLTGKHGPCPLCQAGVDRYRFTDKNGYGLYICATCGSGDGFTFLMRLRGVSFGGAVRMVAPIVGWEQEPSPEVLAKIEEKKRNLAEISDLWRQGKEITRDCPAGMYLTRRTGITEYPCSLRSVMDLPYREDGEEKGRFPALLAYVSGPGGQIVNVYRTYLTQDGEKAPVKNVRKAMRGTMPAGGGIRLGKIEDGKLIVAEGLETAISAGRMHGLAAWAMVNADRMRAWSPPPAIKHVIIAGDHDESFTGQYSAYCLANRLKCQFKVEKVEVSIPMEVGDWNDVYVSGEKFHCP